MKTACGRCSTHLAESTERAFICSFECTFCAECAEGPLANTCPKCLGELLRRPRRKRQRDEAQKEL